MCMHIYMPVVTYRKMSNNKEGKTEGKKRSCLFPFYHGSPDKQFLRTLQCARLYLWQLSKPKTIHVHF